MSICVNVRMSKIMHMPIKVGVCMYARYENCWTLLSWWENTEFQSPLFLVFLSPQTLEVTIFKMGWFGPILELKLILLPLFTAGIAGHQCHIQSYFEDKIPVLESLTVPPDSPAVQWFFSLLHSSKNQHPPNIASYSTGHIKL